MRVGDDAIAITPSGIPYRETTPDDIVVCALADGSVLAGDRKPSSELPLHRAVYAARPETGAVVHTHSPFATTLAVLGKPIPAVHYIISRLGTCEVPVVELRDVRQRGAGPEHVRGALGDDARPAAREPRHARDRRRPREAALNARVLEILATTYWRALAVGTPVILPDEEIGNVIERHKSYGQIAS